MKKVYLVRHGETTHNLENLVQDGTTELTSKGRLQADIVAKRVANLDFTNLIASDYLRALQTAEPIEKLTGIKVEPNELFREIRRPSKFFNKDRNSDEFQQYLIDDKNNFGNNEWRHSDEEIFSHSSKRAVEALYYLKNMTGDTVVVSHGHFIRMLTATVVLDGELLSSEWDKMYKGFIASNTGITTIVFEDRWRLLNFNDHAHFAE